MITFRNRLITIAAAALLPLIILASFLVVVLAERERNGIEASARERLRRVIALADQEVASQIRVLTALSTARSLDSGNLATFYEEAGRVKDQDASWAMVTLADLDGQLLLNLRHPLGAPLGRVVDRASFDAIIATLKPVVSGVSPPGPQAGLRLLALRVPVFRNGSAKYVLSAVMTPGRFQQLLDRAELPPSWSAVIVDRKGAIIARVPHDDALIGTQASESTRLARRLGKEGSYRAVTVDGRRLQALFGTTGLTDWTIHIGIPEQEFDIWFTRSIWLAALGAVGSVVLLVVLLVFLIREVDQHRRADAALRQAQRMEAMGQMTGGVAHDFNNLLMVVIGNIGVAQASPDCPEPVRELLTIAMRAAQRGGTLTQQLLTFARRQTLQTELVDLNRVVDDFAPLIRKALDQSIELQIALAPEAASCRLDVAQFEAAVLNLVVNARDAMPEGGVVTIETRHVTVLSRDGRHAGVAAGRYVLVRVGDTGSGMPPAVIARAFEPFFTTKEVGRGSGLGLSMVYGFAQQSGGDARIESEIGIGTWVNLYLPFVALAGCGASA